MIGIRHLLHIVDAYKLATGIESDSTVSYRVFGDSKKLAALREGADITVGRYNMALCWFWENWPEGSERPASFQPPTSEDAA